MNATWDGVLPSDYDNSNHITEWDYEMRAKLNSINLNPYKPLEKEPPIRYTYTGREMNIETNNFYYRYRMMNSSQGRFTGKDNVFALNLYNYARNNPMGFTDSLGLDPTWDDFVLDWNAFYWETLDFWGLPSFGSFRDIALNSLFFSLLNTLLSTIQRNYPGTSIYIDPLLWSSFGVYEFPLMLKIFALWTNLYAGIAIGTAMQSFYYNFAIPYFEHISQQYGKMEFNRYYLNKGDYDLGTNPALLRMRAYYQMNW